MPVNATHWILQVAALAARFCKCLQHGLSNASHTGRWTTCFHMQRLRELMHTHAHKPHLLYVAQASLHKPMQGVQASWLLLKLARVRDRRQMHNAAYCGAKCYHFSQEIAQIVLETPAQAKQHMPPRLPQYPRIKWQAPIQKQCVVSRTALSSSLAKAAKYAVPQSMILLHSSMQGTPSRR